MTAPTIPHQPTLQPTFFSNLSEALFSPSSLTYRSVYGDETWNTLKPYAIGCGSVMYIQFFLMPFLNLKTYSQLLPQSEYSQGKFCCFRRYFRSFGFCNLWRGFPAAFQGQFAANVIHLYYLRNSQRQPSTLSYEKALTLSMIAVSLATIAYAPFDLIATRQQADVLLPTHYQHNYRSIYSAIPQIVSKESPMTLFRGLQYSLPKNLLTTIGLSAAVISSSQHRPQNSSQFLDTLRYIGCALGVNLLLHPFDSMKTITQAMPTQYRMDNHIVSPIRHHLNQPTPITTPLGNDLASTVQSKLKLRLLWRGVVPQVLACTTAPIATYVIVDFLAKSRLLK